MLAACGGVAAVSRRIPITLLAAEEGYSHFVTSGINARPIQLAANKIPVN
ncbi:MAG: hypothetical protein HFI04_12680 [Lachnospiraceae bacterium]|jgi:hypothetical protein|nr:hypothetical protein [Lachnospiraceae bacterium]